MALSDIQRLSCVDSISHHRAIFGRGMIAVLEAQYPQQFWFSVAETPSRSWCLNGSPVTLSIPQDVVQTESGLAGTERLYTGTVVMARGGNSLPPSVTPLLLPLSQRAGLLSDSACRLGRQTA